MYLCISRFASYKKQIFGDVAQEGGQSEDQKQWATQRNHEDPRWK
jgi:hypothetical protein